jgi:hypothetical protein
MRTWRRGRKNGWLLRLALVDADVEEREKE